MTSNLALVTTGGGARAAYQVGVLRVLARKYPDLEIPILTGVSAGAINAAHLANHSGTFFEAVESLIETWHAIRTEEVFETDVRSLSLNFARWGLRLGSGRVPDSTVKGLVDTAPLRAFLTRNLSAGGAALPGISARIGAGRLRAFGVTATNYGTGQTITWVQGEDLRDWERPYRRGIRAEIGIDHIMASAALPLFFPAVKVGDAWYGDGGIRLTAPLAPALHLGADKILAISTRYGRSMGEAGVPAVAGYPPPAQVIGVLLNAIFLDALDQDAQTLGRINHLVEKLPPDESHPFRRVPHLVLRPSVDLGRLAGEHERDQPRMVRFLMRGLGSDQTASPDWLSMVLFEKDYVAQLIETGERDAEARLDEIRAFVER